MVDDPGREEPAPKPNKKGARKRDARSQSPPRMLTPEEQSALRDSAQEALAYGKERFASKTRPVAGDEGPAASPLPKTPLPMAIDQTARMPGRYWAAFDTGPALHEYLQREFERSYRPHYPVMPLGTRPAPDSSHPEGALRMGGQYCLRAVYVLGRVSGEAGLVDCHPWVQWGTDVAAQLLAVLESSGRRQARVTALIDAGDEDGMELTFFDPLYTERWPYYARECENARYRMFLSGLAVHIRTVQPRDIPVDFAGMIARLQGEGRQVPECLEGLQGQTSASTRGMAMLLATQDEHPDEYEFSGTVMSLKKQAMLGEEGWVAHVRVINGDEDGTRALDLPLAFTRSALQGDLPKVGEDVHGWLWLQGWMHEKT